MPNAINFGEAKDTVLFSKKKELIKNNSFYF